MGALSLPAGGRVWLDANALIYSVEQIPPYWPLLEPLWAAVIAGTVRAAGSELLVLEALVGPIKRGNAPLLADFDAVFASGQLELFAITHRVLRRAAELRAAHGLKTPDAIHAAPALVHGCDLFVTNESVFRRVPGLPVMVLSDLLGP